MVDFKGNMGIIIMVAIALLIGVVLMTQLGDSVASVTKTDSVDNESFVGLVDNYVALTNDDLSSVSEIRNASHIALTVNTDYVVNLTDGGINITAAGNNTDVDPNTFYVDYVYFGDNYVKNSTSRIITNLIVIFFAIFLMAIAVMAFRGQFEGMFKN